jgi:putative redox protein
MKGIMDIQLNWISNKHFQGTNESGAFISIDASKDHGGEGNGPSPMELVLMGVGGCTGMDVIDILKKMRQDVTRLIIRVHADRAEEHPKVFTKMIIEYIIIGNQIDPKHAERAIQMSCDKYCSGIAMMKKTVDIEFKWTIQPPSKESHSWNTDFQKPLR